VLGENLLEIDVKVRRLLTELAYLACMTNDVLRARKILDGLTAVAPDSAETAVGYALADMTARDFESSIRRLQPLADAGDPHGTVLFGLALKLAGRTSESEAALAKVPAGDPAVDALATALR
jgi:hypothetical protein